MSDKPQRIYVVTSGAYSDYGIRALFSRKPAATAFAVEHNKQGGDNAAVEDWPLDDRIDDVCGAQYTCALNLATGEVVDEWQDKGLHPRHARVLYTNSRHTLVWARATTPQLAKKAAIEKRQEVLRSGVTEQRA